MFIYPFPKVDHTVDIVIFRTVSIPRDEQKPNGPSRIQQVLLIRRRDEPYKNHWAFVGGFLDVGKDTCLEDAAYRETLEEVGIPKEKLLDLRQLHTYSQKDRDPRGWVVSTVFTARVDSDAEAVAGDDAKELRWQDCKDKPVLAFDHPQIWDDLEDRGVI